MTQQEPIRVGIIGLGRAGWGMHVPELRGRTDFRIVAGCDPIGERQRELEQEFGAKGYGDYKDLLRDPAVELVVVATRQDTHAAITMQALRAGKHVIVEKPVAVDLAETDAMIEASRRTGRILMARQNRRFDPDFLHVREVIASRLLGDVFYIRLCRHWFGRRKDWQTLRRFGGGLLNNWGPHIIDHALQFLGGHPTELFADLRSIASAGDAEDHVKIVMKGDSGLVVDLEISGAIAIGEPIYRVMGSMGTLVCDGAQSTCKYLVPKELRPAEADPETPKEQGFMHDEELPWHEETRPAVPGTAGPAFYDLVYPTVRLGEPFPITLAEVRNVMWVIEKAREETAFRGGKG